MTTATEARPYEAQRSQFEGETTEHVLTVKQDDGLYRHLRFCKPGTSMWSFELVTWPGHLAITGDIGDGWVFARDPDMIEFFKPRSEPYRIDADYWWQKMPSQLRDAARKFSESALREQARTTIEEWSLGDVGRSAALAKLDEAWGDVFYGTEQDYREVVDEFRFEYDGTTFEFSDTWEWSAMRYDHHFLLALFAITFGVEKYQAWKADQIPEVTDTLLIDQGWTRPADERLVVEPEVERDCA
jgi:hypothetical protein